MALPAKLIRRQLRLLRPVMSGLSLETIRKGQDAIGELMAASHRKDCVFKDHPFEQFDAGWVIPRDERRSGVILYLHGGGYTCGDLHYARGFGSALAARFGIRVLCAAYRLAPEHPAPAALEDTRTAYEYLLSKGYAPEQIILCGESAGGGLCVALCLKLKEAGLPLPGGIVAISPWTDLTGSADSYRRNRTRDPSLSQEILDFYAACYTVDRRDPLVSPVFGDLTGLPPTLIFVGGDEILLDDAVSLHEKLLACGCESWLRIAPGMWHGYILYDLKENAPDMDRIGEFLNSHGCPRRKLRWLKLDNAAKIYPAALGRNWSNVFRLSATLTEEVDVPVLQSALDVTVRRFPSIAARLRRGFFWYYLEQVPQAPAIRQELSCPLARMPMREIRKCAFRVVVYQKRIAVEFFHSLCDGNGGLIFLKSLVAEYIHQKYGIAVPAEHGVLGRLENPTSAELEDSFPKFAGPIPASRSATTAWHFTGTPNPDGLIDLTCFRLPVEKVLEQAHSHGVSVTAFLCATMMEALLNLQLENVPNIRRRRPIKVLLPVNLRKLFPSTTLRNFVMYTVPEVDPRQGSYDFHELCRHVHYHMGLNITKKSMASLIATNVRDESKLLIRMIPMFLKNIAMKAVFDAVGECKSCLSLSNLGVVRMPEEMKPFVSRLDFILSPQAHFPHNCGCICWGDTIYLSMIRKIKEPDLEAHLYRVLRRQGIPVLVESNER